METVLQHQAREDVSHSFNWTAGGSTAQTRTLSYLWRERQGRALLVCSTHTHTHTCFHTHSGCAYIIIRGRSFTAWGMQTDAATGMTWEEKHINLDIIQTWHAADWLRTGTALWLCLNLPDSHQDGPTGRSRDLTPVTLEQQHDITPALHRTHCSGYRQRDAEAAR